MTNRRLLLVVVLALSAPIAYGQAVVQGRVLGDGGPLPGAHIQVEGTPLGVAADASGHYRLAGLAPGRHVLVVSAVGFATQRQPIHLRAADVTETMDVFLRRAVLAGEEVVVTGTMRERYVKESPVKVSVVRAERLQRGRARANLMDLIGSVGGLTTQLNCGVCGTNAIRINGVQGPNTAVLIDGMPIMGALASVYGLNGISPSIIDQVEVIKGPQSTLYGTQALGGVVNIITKDPTHTPTFSVDAYGRSTHEGSVNLAASPQVGRFKGFVSASGLRMEHYFDNNGDGFADVPKRSRIGLFGKGALASPDGIPMLSVAAKLYGEDRTGGTVDFTDALRGSGAVYGESIYTHRAELLTEVRPPGLDQRLRIRSALTVHDQDSYYGMEHYDAQQRIVFGQATWDQLLTGALRLLTGTTLRYEMYDDNTPATPAADRRFIPGIFAQSELMVGDVTLLGGLRLDHHTEHGVVTAPRLSAKYSPSDRTTLRASSGTGFRVVNVFTEDHAALTGSRRVVFAEDLRPEQSRSVTVGAEHILPFGANPLIVSVDGFYTRFSNKIIPDYDQDPNLIVYENLDGFSVTRGFSIDVDQNFTAWPVRYDASFTLMDVFTAEGGARRAVAYAPDYTGTAGLTYQWRAVGLDVAYGARLVGPKRMPDGYVEEFGRARRSPTYTVHNLKVTKEFSSVNGPRGVGVEAYLSIENLFDYAQGSPLVGAATPFSPAFDTIYTWGPIVGRTFSLGVRMNLR
jgi:outer membrane receptor for ferrienterochelin and colicins